MEELRKNENIELEKNEGKKPGIVEVELNSGEGLVFFGTCHCSNGSMSVMLF